MKKNKIQKTLSSPTFIILFITGILLILFLFLRMFKNSGNASTPIKEGQIQIVKGDEVITINQNGLVEYKSKDRSYSETWDASQINSFFSMMERKARDYLARRVSGGDCGYKVFIFIDGKLVTLCVDSNDRDMTETVEPVFIRYSDVNLSDYFGDDDVDESGDEDEFNGVIDFPTPTTGFLYSTPTPTPYSIGGDTNYAPVKAGCENWSQSIVNNRAIISNTYCTVDSTPTP